MRKDRCRDCQWCAPILTIETSLDDYCEAKRILLSRMHKVENCLMYVHEPLNLDDIEQEVSNG